jgi:predicted ribosome quality control (RQC) complex YloA/Tae2 family protein
MQKIYSSPHYISISARLPGKTIFLYLGRGEKFEGLFIGNRTIPSKYRIRDRFIEFCRKYLQGGIITDISVEDNDRLLKLSFKKRELSCDFYLFWKGRELFFSYVEKSQEKRRVFRSWIGWEELYEDIAVDELFLNLGVGKVKTEKEAKGHFDEEEYFSNLEKNVDVHKFPKRKKKFFQRKIVNIEKDLTKVKKWKELKQLIESDDFVTPMDYKFKLLEIPFKMDKSINEYKRRDLFYKKIKSFRAAESILQDRLDNTKAELSKWINGDIFVVKGLGKTIEPVWKSVKLEKNTTEKGVNKKIISLGGDMKIAIGLDTKANDWIRSNWAKKNDMWFHIDGETSSHIFLKNPKDIKLDHNLLQLIGSILKEYSRFSGEQIPLLFTQAKNLKSVKGSPGKVIFKKEKRMDVYFLPSWKERISIIS